MISLTLYTLIEINKYGCIDQCNENKWYLLQGQLNQIRTVHPTRRTDQPARTRTRNHPNRPLRRRLQVATHRTRHTSSRLASFLPKTQATQPDHKTKNLRRYLKDFQQKLTKIDGIWSSPAKNTWNPIRPNEIRWDLREIQQDLVVIWLDLDGSGQNNITSNPTQHPMIQPKPNETRTTRSD